MQVSELIIPTDYRQAHDSGLKYFLETGKGPILNYRIERIGLRKDGTEFPLEIAVTPIKTNSDFVFYAFVRDLTELKKSEKERLRLLQESHARRELLELLLKHIPAGILLTTGDDMCLEIVNPVAKEIEPFPFELGKSLFEHAPKNETIDQLKKDYQLTLHGKNSHIVDMLVPGKPLPDGTLEEHYYTNSRLQVNLPDGRVGVLSIGLETTEQVKLRRELETRVEARTQDLFKANTFLNAIIENIPDMIFVKDAKELRFIRFNKAAEELLGYSREELVGKNDYDFFPKAEAEFFIAKDREVFAKKTVLDIPEETIQTRLKGKRILHTKKVPFYNKEGEPELLIGISEDITDKKEAENTLKNLWQEKLARSEAEKAIQLRDEFISIAAHELKNPLTALSMQIQLLSTLSAEIESNKAQKYLELMKSTEEDLGRFIKLVDDLLDVSRANSRTLILARTKVNLSELVAQVAKTYEANFIKSNCKVKLNTGQSVIGIWDKVRLEQVLVNLISNAVKYGAGSPIEITTKIEGDLAVLKVKDHGIGVSKCDQVKIFNQYERGSITSNADGVGLGLYITYQIVIAHKGTIRIESEVGKGSTFIMELPLEF